MGYKISHREMERILAELAADYDIYAPVQFANGNSDSGSGPVRYARIHSFEDIVYDRISEFSPKEIFYPIIQKLFSFQNGNCEEQVYERDRKTLIFLRACDINGIKRLDQIFLGNGDNQDLFYQRQRENLYFAVMDCKEGWDTCFCVSMNAGSTDNYSLAFRWEDDFVLAEVKEAEMEHFFHGERDSYTFQPVQKNKKSVHVPQITDRSRLAEIYGLEMWKKYNESCIGCGGCSTVCISCSCFDTVDVTYNESGREGERRRVWASCMQKEYTTMAGGHSMRTTAGDRMRFKTLHKIYDYRFRFGGTENMCVGCGRCDLRCPASIRFSDVINELNSEIMGGTDE